MKTTTTTSNVKISYFLEKNSGLEVHIESSAIVGKYNIVFYEGFRINEDQWIAYYKDASFDDDFYELPDTLKLSEEELFQLSTVWDYEENYSFILALQAHINEVKKGWGQGFYTYYIELEY